MMFQEIQFNFYIIQAPKIKLRACVHVWSGWKHYEDITIRLVVPARTSIYFHPSDNKVEWKNMTYLYLFIWTITEGLSLIREMSRCSIEQFDLRIRIKN